MAERATPGRTAMSVRIFVQQDMLGRHLLNAIWEESLTSQLSIVAPLVVGLVALGVFVAYENAPFVIEPVTPPRLFSNRTSLAVFAATFLNSALLYWVMFFLPVYFQAVLLSSPTRAGVQLLPIITIAVPAAIIAVLLLAKWGKYKPLHLGGFAVCTIGLGLFTLLDENSSMAEWVIFQVITGAGSGYVSLSPLLLHPSVSELFW